VAWSPFVAQFETVFQGISATICYIAPPITVVFVLGVFWRRASSRGAIVTLMTGSALGLTVFLLDWFKDRTGWEVQFMMAAFYLAVICAVVHVLVSLLFPDEPSPERDRLVWASPLAPFRTDAGRSIIPNAIAAVLFVVMVALYVVFA
jgi:SSS family solute:Na+ symporter